MDNLNFFAPFERLAAHHENQLTRALLVVLRLSPMAHALWLRMVDPSIAIESLGPVKFRTQMANPTSRRQTGAADEALRGISVFLAPDAGQITSTVASTDRTQILDGIVEYGESLVVVIENKITFGTTTDQPTSINTFGVPIEFDSQVRVVKWQDLLAHFADMVSSKNVSGAEQAVVEDFLELAEEHFPHIGPYSTLRRAGLSALRVQKRLENVLGAAVGDTPMPSVKASGAWRLLPMAKDHKSAVSMVQLSLEGDQIVLALHPGDTLGQARILYSRADAARSLLDLQGWSVKPNYHWGYMVSGMAWHKGGSISARKYIEYWISHSSALAAVSRDRWSSYWDELTQAGIVGGNDREDFDEAFVAKGDVERKYTSATPRPGITCTFDWPLADAVSLDQRGAFGSAVSDRIEDFLDHLGEPDMATRVRAARVVSKD